MMAGPLIPVSDPLQFVAALVDIYLLVTIATVVTVVVADHMVSTSSIQPRVGDAAVSEWQAYGFLVVVFAVAVLVARLVIHVVANQLGLSVVNRAGLLIILLWLLGVSRTDLLLVPQQSLVRLGVVVGFWAVLHQPVLSNEGYLLIGGLLTFIAFYQETFDLLRELVHRARQ